MTFVEYLVNNGGCIKPLIVKDTFYNGTGLFNPSIVNDNGILRVCIRHCQYTIYHAEKGRFEHHFGPLVYLNPESDLTLTTKNYISELDSNLELKNTNIIDTSTLDKPPLWTFVGLEDVRLIKWDNKLFACGVRRDTTTNGQGRMELSEITINSNLPKEVSRFRIPAPGLNDSYCEKNWMPVTDLPYHFVKWSNPTEVVKVDIEKGSCNTVYLGNYMDTAYDYRGGSQVISYKNYRIACVHTVNLYKSEAGRKNATYRHCFIVWDREWNIVKITKQFSFLNGEIEFCAGMAEINGIFYITFGFQDNTAFILRLSQDLLDKVINDEY
jgi:hypothetical protein